MPALNQTEAHYVHAPSVARGFDHRQAPERGSSISLPTIIKQEIHGAKGKALVVRGIVMLSAAKHLTRFGLNVRSA